MSTFLVFALFGAATGSLYALSALGIVVISRGSGVLNLATGAVGMVAAYLFNSLRLDEHWPLGVALVATLLVCAVIGILIHRVVTLRNSTALARVVVCLASLLALQGLIDVLPFRLFFIPLVIPTTPIEIGNIGIGSDRIVLIGISMVITIGLWALLRFSRFGLAVTGSAENPMALSTLGWSPGRVASVTWAIGSMLAGLAGVLIAPLFGISTGLATLLLLPALASAVIGNLTSLSLTFAGAVLIGVLQAEVERYVDFNGLADAIPFGVVVVVAIVRGRRVPTRAFSSVRLPRVTVGRPSTVIGLLAALAFCACFIWLPINPSWNFAISMTVSVAVVLESVVVLTGFAGQISFVQWALAGVGGLVFSQLFVAGWPPEVAIPLSVLVGALCGAVVGLAALRVRGMDLAIVTLALNVVIVAMVFGTAALVGGMNGLFLPRLSLFGVSLDSEFSPGRFGAFVVVVATATAFCVLNLRRGRSGRRLMSVRANERAAAMLGIGVTEAKLWAFTYGGALASLGGILIVLHYRVPQFSTFDAVTSIQVLAFTVIGGIGFVLGPLFGASLIGAASPSTTGIGLQILSIAGSGAGKYLTLLTGLIVLAVTIIDPDGVFGLLNRISARLRSRFGGSVNRERSSRAVLPRIVAPGTDGDLAPALAAAHLEVTDVVVAFGPLHAVDGVSFELHSGEVLGIIGANGAGKTVLIDAISGFARMRSGSVHVNGHDVSHLSTTQRVGLGLARTFQSLELFEDMTVLENLLVACEPKDRAAWLTDLVHPGTPSMTSPQFELIERMRLVDDLGRLPTELSFGRRRLVALCRAIIARPSIVLLDEPAASLDESEREDLGVLIRWLAELGVAVLLIEHDVDFVCSHSDRMVAMDLGKVVATGSPDEVRSAPRVIAAYLGEPVPA
jgi:ABC-type branched-subunit amino acid transport system ATPase component/branched-subunit amino acid ABC-type transport system permease component